MKESTTLNTILQEIIGLKEIILRTLPGSPISHEWISRREAMQYLGYADTQMAALEKSGKIIVAKVGKRKFMQRDSLRKLIEASIQ